MSEYMLIDSFFAGTNLIFFFSYQLENKHFLIDKSHNTTMIYLLSLTKSLSRKRIKKSRIIRDNLLDLMYSIIFYRIV